jgi:osmotically-inducible protein OsmY
MPTQDETIQREILAELSFDEAVAALEIGVAVRAGVVTLSGAVATGEQRDRVVATANRVAGVKAIAEELRVLPAGINRTDTELAHAVVQALLWEPALPPGLKARVDEGWVWLEGVVHTDAQKSAAERAVGFLTGVKGITNGIVIRRPGTTSPAATG